MKLHRKRGATLGLVAACVFVVIILGVGFFILSKIIGGEREVANATDAGVLTVAKNALSPTLVKASLSDGSLPAAAKDFVACDPNATGTTVGTGNIDMVTLNRVIGQAVLVALNAKQLNTTEAGNHAVQVADAAKKVSTLLRDQLLTGTDSVPGGSGGPLQTAFSNVASRNNTKMWQGNPVKLTGSNLTSRFLRNGYSTNVYFNPALGLNALAPPGMLNDTSSTAHSAGEYYMAGYKDITITAGGKSIKLTGVPVFPKTRPHIIDVGEYNAAPTGQPFAGANYLPPNGFRAQTAAFEGSSATTGGSLACAVIGCLDSDFAASIPRGYVRITNGRDANSFQPAGPITNPVIDGSQDIFNNELWAGAGSSISQSDNGVFTTNGSLLQKWITFNKDREANDYASTLTPTEMTQMAPYRGASGKYGSPTLFASLGLSSPINPTDGNGDPVFRYGPGAQEAATDAQILDAGVSNSSVLNCNSEMYDQNPPSGCVTNLDTWTTNYARSSTAGSPDTTKGFSNLEYLKAKLLESRVNHHTFCFHADTGTYLAGGPSGMKLFQYNTCIPSSSTTGANFGDLGSPLAYLRQAACGSQSTCPGAEEAIDKIWNRLLQADTQITRPQVVAALSTAPGDHSKDLAMGKSFYLYATSPGTGNVTLSAAPSGSYFQAYPFTGTMDNDGMTSALKKEYSAGPQNPIFKTIDASTDSGCSPKGDANYHEVPYTHYSVGAGEAALKYTDKAIWSPSSGYGNLLGDLLFENDATGAGTFCKPN